MARVFVAHDETLGREVIVKVLPPELTYGFSAARFTREFKLAATLQEPHIVPVLTAGQTVGGLPFYTMPFVRGESLRVRVRRGRVPLDECMTIMRDIALALAYAHKQGIVHRDIKPENILLSEGTAVVTDFGIAKAVQAAMTATPPEGPGGGGLAITLPGDTVGTPAYMSPEQAAADPTTDQRADIYAWGVVAYELLAGKHPFAEKTNSPQALLTAQMSDTPPSITAESPGVPRPIAELVMSCLSKTASMRPANGSALLAALDDPSTARRPRIGVDRLGSRAPLIATLVLALVLVGAAVWRARAASARPPLIAVLPFETEGVGADSSFADGLRDAVTGKLARLTGLSVIDRKSVLSLATSPATTAQQAGKSLGADYVLQASVRWAKGADGKPRVRVSPMLIRVSDGTTRWAGEPEIVSPADPFTIQASVATRVAEAMDVVMADRERTTMARRATSDTGAFAAVIRGKRISEENRTSSYREYERALRYFESAYQRDPDYADALGLAGQALAGMSYAGGAKLLDSASVLAQRALDLDPTQVNAVATLAFRGFGRPAEALGILRQALRENPSSIDLLTYEQRALVFVGDSAGAWEAVQRILPLAPASKSVLATCFRTALALRRYSDARDLVARERALDPAALGPIFDAATLSAKLGDRASVGQAVLELQSRGGRLGASDGELMRNGDSWLQNELATGSLASFAPGSALDSVSFYAEKAELFLSRGDNARALGLADSAWRLEKRMVDDPKQSNFVRRTQYEVLAWLAALRGDRATGYPIAYLNDPEFGRNRDDPRFRALVGKLASPR
jgi:serine/threonine-protein kinase